MIGRIHRASTLILLAALIGATGLFVSCEDDADTVDVDAYLDENGFESGDREETARIMEIEPQNATVTYVGQRVQFTARGGTGPYTWAASDPAAGTVTIISDTGWSDAVYAALAVAPNTVVVTDTAGHTAVASIDRFVSNLQITPTGVTLGTAGGQVAVFTAAGGTPPYDWQSVFPALGTIAESGSNDETGTYTSFPGAGTNQVTVIDASGGTVQASVFHN